MTRKEILDEAIRQVTGHRVEDYGSAENSFQVIADFWTVWLGDRLGPDGSLTAKDVAMMMALMKIARAQKDIKSDTYVDLAGYAACGGEIVTEASRRNEAETAIFNSFTSNLPTAVCEKCARYMTNMCENCNEFNDKFVPEDECTEGDTRIETSRTLLETRKEF